ncbi:hypothetical protein G7085_10075 [Tessaracoccus sp. HDW20]|uniref:hypothetical protein n=1 Tax=Tessaracoccus coleopterorum TaxID=2714950 RepID=UPI0018D3F40D|nr:hypothetical protein [Tessaracoccus coleopterorum]NHB84826.1 hypothetical protein [Tessaracoccus coleopterorum]
MRNPVVIERDGMLLLRTAYGWRGQQEYTLGIRAADGAVPRWLADGPAFQVVDGVAVLTGTDGTDGWSLDTWRRLWRREEKWGHGYVVGDALLLESPEACSGSTRGRVRRAGLSPTQASSRG